VRALIYSAPFSQQHPIFRKGDRKLKQDTASSQGGMHPDYEEERRYFDQRKVYSVQIESNLACPQNCLYCYASLDNPPVKELPKAGIEKILTAAAKMGVRSIDWLGGDPLVRADWFALMNEATKKGLKNNIWTSGILLEQKKVARKAVEAATGGFIAVHLDTLDEHIYKILHKGDPQRQIQAILAGVENLKSLGKEPDELYNCITFTRPVANDVEKTIRFFYDTYGIRTCLTQMCLAGLATEHEDWVPSLKEIRAACDIRDAINYPGSTHSFSSMDTNKYYCGNMICVTVEGDVTPCSVIRKSVGNIHRNSLEQIVNSHRDELLWLKLREPESLPGHCASCENNSVCWGCRAAAYYDSGDACGMDPKCYKNKQMK
jgi:radical SAM protein with 4Fe4S-binding SPASM domain